MSLHDRLFTARAEPGDDAQWAASGAMALTGREDGPPQLAPRSLMPFLRAVGGVLADAGVTVDPPALLGERAAIAGLTRHGRRSCGGATELHRCADGWVAVSLARPDDVDLLPAWLGTDDPAIGLAGRRAAEVVAAGVELGIPCSRLGEIDASAPAFVARPLAAGPPRPSVAGALVVDLSSLWAGPLCAQLLTAAGARTVKVESTSRPDGARRGPAPFYDLLHAGQDSVALDFRDHRDVDRLRTLLAAADVVVEASRPRALAQLGIDAAACAAADSGVWISITGYGRDGPAAQRVAFGDDAAVAGGLIGGDRTDPVFCADAVADPLAGLTAAVAALACHEAGGSWLVDVAMARVAAWCARLPPSPGPWTGPVAPPRARRPAGPAAPLGRDSAVVLGRLRT